MSEKHADKFNAFFN